MKMDINTIKSPAYVFDITEFEKRIDAVKAALSSEVGLVFSIKANPFLTKYISNSLSYLEVCSPGELTICEKSGVDLTKVIFSGVNKTEDDVSRALDDNVGIFTAESLKHVNIINDLSKQRKMRVPIILRLSCGNQFGMDEKDVCQVIEHRDEYEGLDIIGLHMYTGTQKKKSSQIAKELNLLDEFIKKLKNQYNYDTKHVEYGPGMAVEYFSEDADEKDMNLLGEVCALINDFSKKHPITIEMGRFLAAECGTYYTKVMDTKAIGDINYCICDGGVHQVKYFGQTMAMQVPKMEVINAVDDKTLDWSVCGSLCTTADVLVRKVSLTGLGQGSIISFGKVGAYSVCEGISLFLSRELPAIYIDNGENLIQARDITYISEFNMEGRA